MHKNFYNQSQGNRGYENYGNFLENKTNINSTLASRANNTSIPNLNDNNREKEKNKVICYNCDKISYLARDYYSLKSALKNLLSPAISLYQ